MTTIAAAAPTTAHTAASTPAMAPSSNEPNARDMLDALKRKVVDLDSQLQASNDQVANVERSLEMEKREHLLTTNKLSMLLKKRSSAAANSGDEPPTDVSSLRHQIGCLREQLAASEAREGQLKESYATLARHHEQLRVLTLEGFRSHGRDATVSSSDAHGTNAPLTVSTGHDSTSVPLQCNSPAVREAVRLAENPIPLTYSASSESLHLPNTAWRPPPTNHAQPRVGAMVRSNSMPHPHDNCSLPLKPNAAGAAPYELAPAAAQPCAASLVDVSNAACGAAGGGGCSAGMGTGLGAGASNPAMDPLARQDMLKRAPQGYARGAISVEPPKRQRKNAVQSLVPSSAVSRG